MKHVPKTFPQLEVEYHFEPMEYDFFWGAVIHPESIEITDIKMEGWGSLPSASQMLLLQRYEQVWIEEIKEDQS